MTTNLEPIEGFLTRRIGLRLDRQMRQRLHHYIQEGARSAETSAEEFAMRLARDEQQVQRLINTITVQETSFFRHKTQFDALAQSLFLRVRHPLTIWSAGCATGQEAWSLAIALADAGHPDGRVLATDVSTKALAIAQKGEYGARDLRPLSELQRTAHFTKRGETWTVSQELRRRVTFMHHNLVDDGLPAAPGVCSVIFCRNVLIYFQDAELLGALDHFWQALPTEGFLMLGAAESLWHVTDRFHLLPVGGAFVYQKPGSPTHDEPLATGEAETTARAPGKATRRPSSTKPGPGSRRAGKAATNLPDPESGPEPEDVAQHPLGAQASVLIRQGEEAMAAESWADAVDLFRKAVYLQPDNPICHLHLGLAFDATGDHDAMHRSLNACLTALERGAEAIAEVALEGYSVVELKRYLDHRLKGRR